MVRSLLVVSALLVACAQAQAQFDADPLRNWSSVRTSVVNIEDSTRSVGVGVLIDRDGYFLVHRQSLPSTQSVGRLSNGQPVLLTLKALDETSQLALVQAEPWMRNQGVEVALSAVDLKPNSKLMIGVPSGPMVGELVSADRSGILRPSLRYAPLLELRCEAPTDRLGGALVFSTDGTLAGIINATLEPVRSNLIPQGNQNRSFGPRPMTTSYALGPEILAKVIEGFRSPSRRVVYPVIGAFFSDATQGVLVQEVRQGSPAAQAGVQSGDVILQMNSKPIKDSVDFAIQLFRQRVGSVISLQVRRGQQNLDLKVAVAGADDTLKPLN